MSLKRDPLSEWFDAAARRLLERAYRHRGEWTGIYLAQPGLRQHAAAARIGIWDLRERDRWGEVRWVRAFKRAVFWHHRMYGYSDEFRPGRPRASDHAGTSLEWQTGQLVMKSGWPGRRWAIRVRIHPAGAEAGHAAAEKIPASRRWVIAGQPTARQSTIADRDWEP
jgi:hypothetical protein